MRSKIHTLARKGIYRIRDAAERAIFRWKVVWRARGVIRQLRRLKAANGNRPFCGILLVEHIGDIIACEPVVGWVRREFPNGFVVWVVKEAYSELVADHPGLDAVVSVDSLAVVGAIVKAGIFDHPIDLHVNHKPTGVLNFAHIKRWGDPSVDLANYFRYGTLLGAFSKAAGIPKPSEAPQLHVPDDVIRSVDSLGLPGRFVVVHATSNEAAKDWPTAEWNELASYMTRSCGLAIVEVGLTKAITFEHERVISLCGRLSLLQTAEVVRRSSFFIGIDSAVAHMANVWRTPSLLLFGRYRGEDDFVPYDGYFGRDPERWILRATGQMTDLRASEVIGRLTTTEPWRSTVCVGSDANKT
jgi:heptosyltransferase-3